MRCGGVLPAGVGKSLALVRYLRNDKGGECHRDERDGDPPKQEQMSTERKLQSPFRGGVVVVTIVVALSSLVQRDDADFGQMDLTFAFQNPQTPFEEGRDGYNEIEQVPEDLNPS